jgi:hypothetical protein
MLVCRFLFLFFGGFRSILIEVFSKNTTTGLFDLEYYLIQSLCVILNKNFTIDSHWQIILFIQSFAFFFLLQYNGDCGGCTSCTAEVLGRERNTKGKTIRQSITYHIKTEGKTETKACKLICGEKFSDICGKECDPDRCTRTGFQPFTSKPDLEAAVETYCANAQRWESDDLFNTYG